MVRGLSEVVCKKIKQKMTEVTTPGKKVVVTMKGATKYHIFKFDRKFSAWYFTAPLTDNTKKETFIKFEIGKVHPCDFIQKTLRSLAEANAISNSDIDTKTTITIRALADSRKADQENFTSKVRSETDPRVWAEFEKEKGYESYMWWAGSTGRNALRLALQTISNTISKTNVINLTGGSNKNTNTTSNTKNKHSNIINLTGRNTPLRKPNRIFPIQKTQIAPIQKTRIPNRIPQIAPNKPHKNNSYKPTAYQIQLLMHRFNERRETAVARYMDIVSTWRKARADRADGYLINPEEKELPERWYMWTSDGKVDFTSRSKEKQMKIVAEKQRKEAEKRAEKAARNARDAAAKKQREAEKAALKAAKNAEKAAKNAEKAAKNAEKAAAAAMRKNYVDPSNGQTYKRSILKKLRNQNASLNSNNKAAMRFKKIQEDWKIAEEGKIEGALIRPDNTDLRRRWYWWTDDGPKSIRLEEHARRAAKKEAEQADKNARNAAAKKQRETKIQTMLNQGVYKKGRKSYNVRKLNAVAKLSSPPLSRNNAVIEYERLKAEKPGREESGWAVDVNNNALNKKVYYYWTGGKRGKHEKVSRDELPQNKNMANMTRENVEAALKRRKKGWNKDRSAYMEIDPDNPGNLVRISKDILDRVRNRILQLLPSVRKRYEKKLVSNTKEAEAYLDEQAATRYVQHAKKQNRNNAGGVFNYYRNVYRGAGGNAVNNAIPGGAFAQKYANRLAKKQEAARQAARQAARAARGPSSSNNNNNNKSNRFVNNTIVNYTTSNNNNDTANQLNNNVAENVANTYGPGVVIEEAEKLEKPRREVDKEFLRELSAGNWTKFKAWLVKVYSRGGPLINRPLMTGNVGTPGIVASPKEQIDNQKGDACVQLAKKWDGRQGASLMIHQSVVFLMSRLRAENEIQTPGLLVLHSVGSGKTLSGLACMIAFWNSPMSIIPFSVRSNSNNNGLEKMAELAAKYFPWFRSTHLSEDIKEEYPFAHGKENALKHIRRRLRKSFGDLGMSKDGVSKLNDTHLLGSIATISHDFDKMLKKKKVVENCVFIVDEIHMMITPPPTESFPKEYAQMKEILTTGRDPRSTWVLGMTATVGETVEQVEAVMNMIAAQPIKTAWANIKKDGLVSFAYTQGDTTRFPTLTVKHECLPLDTLTDFKLFKDIYMSQLKELEETQKAMLNSGRLDNSGGGTLKLKAVPATKTAGNTNPYTSYVTQKKFTLMKRVRQKTEYIQIGISTAIEIENSENNVKNTGKKTVKKNDGNKNNENAENPVDTLNNATAKNITKIIEGLGRTRAQTRGGVAAPTKGGPVETPEKSVQEKLDELATDPTREWGVVRATNGYLENKPKVQQRQSGRTAQQTAQPVEKEVGEVENLRRSHFILSPKLAGVIESILTSKGVHYVYSAESWTLRLIAHVLESRHEFELFTEHTNKKVSGLRYCFIDSNQKKTYKLYCARRKKNISLPTIKERDVKRAIGVLRDTRNMDGDMCKVVLASQSSYKGVDIKFVRHVHCVSMMPDLIDLLQLVGRGTRNCGHGGMQQFERIVTFHFWKLIGEKQCPTVHTKIFPDCYLFDRALKAYDEGYGKLEQSLIDASVDQTLFQKYTDSANTLHQSLREGCPDRLSSPKWFNPENNIKKIRNSINKHTKMLTNINKTVQQEIRKKNNELIKKEMELLTLQSELATLSLEDPDAIRRKQEQIKTRKRRIVVLKKYLMKDQNNLKKEREAELTRKLANLHETKTATNKKINVNNNINKTLNTTTRKNNNENMNNKNSANT